MQKSFFKLAISLSFLTFCVENTIILLFMLTRELKTNQGWTHKDQLAITFAPFILPIFFQPFIGKLLQNEKIGKHV